MTQGDPTKWQHFEQMDTVEFLQMCLFYHDKQEDLRLQAELNKR
jgi:hypothetical protein